MNLIIYNVAVRSYGIAIWMVSHFNPKAKLWWNGRKDIFERLEKAIGQNAKNIWIHVASLGEFEQGKPIIEALKSKYPDHKILLTFFSPSGYEIRKNYAKVDYVFYLPLDTAKNAKRFLDIVQPKVVFFVKYEFWYHFLHHTQKRKIPTILISAIFRSEQIFFKPYGKWYRQIVAGFDFIFVQNKASKTLLETIQIPKSIVAGDTRVDSVMSAKAKAIDFEVVKRFKNNKKTLVVGSSWQPDEALINAFLEKYQNKLPFNIILAPHKIEVSNIERIQRDLSISSIRYSEATIKNVLDYDVLIIDNIGMLTALYQYGNMAYIGGALGSGLHNILEPMAFDLPVIFGSRYQKFSEAVEMVDKGGAISIKDFPTFEKAILKLLEKENHQKAVQVVQQYMIDNQGATKKILNMIGDLVRA